MEVSRGVKKEILREGSGNPPKVGDRITVHCTGFVAKTNAKFWSTHDPGQQTFQFNVGLRKVIQGWDEGCITMKKGEYSRLYIVGDKAYGSNGFPAWGYHVIEEVYQSFREMREIDDEEDGDDCSNDDSEEWDNDDLLDEIKIPPNADLIFEIEMVDFKSS